MATISLTGLNVEENSKIGTSIGTFSVDFDEYFDFSLSGEFNDRLAIVLNEDDGKYHLVVKTAATSSGSLFDFESALKSFTIMVSAQGDEGTSVGPTSFTINVVNVNEAPTDVVLKTLSAPVVAENAVTGAEIGLLSAVDPDLTDTFTFTLKDSADGRFKLDATGTKLLVADGTRLDYETAKSHQIKIVVKDALGLTFEKTLTIGVTDGIDTVSGTSRNDKLSGTEAADIILGFAGNDKIRGLGGDDIINGGAGKDQLTGGLGRDTFVFDSALRKGGFDMVTDFNSADDTLQFNLAALSSFKVKGLKAGKLPKKFFTVGTESKDKNDYVYADKKNGFVYLDADGSGSHKGVAILKLKPGTKISADDFLFI